MGTRRHGTRAGMTLLELMLVMFLLAMILGTGLGLFAALDGGKRQAAGVVRSVVRTAQNTAIASDAPARVRIDAKAGTIQAESMLRVGTYQFEDGAVTGYGPEGSAEPEWFTDDGYLGAAFHPAGKHEVEAVIPIAEDSAFDLTRGFAFECWVLREGSGGGRILSVGAADPYTVALDLGGAGDLRASFRTRVGEENSERGGASVIAHSEPGLVHEQRWSRVGVRYDRERFELLLDGTVVASQPETSFVWRVDGPLTLSDRKFPFPGKIDALVLAVMVADEPARLPDSVHFSADSPAVLEFEPGGALDRRVHRDPPRITLEFDDGARTAIHVGFYGTVE